MKKLPITMMALALTGALASSAHAATVLTPTADHYGRGSTGTVANGTANNLAIGAVDGSNNFFRPFLTFDLTGQPAATTSVELKLFGIASNENNTTALTQTFTLYQLAADWVGTPSPGPASGADLATITFTTELGNTSGDLLFSSQELTDAYNASLGGDFFLGIRSSSESSAPGTRSFLWMGSSDPDKGPGPELAIDVVPEPGSTALLGLAGLALIIRRRR